VFNDSNDDFCQSNASNVSVVAVGLTDNCRVYPSHSLTLILSLIYLKISFILRNILKNVLIVQKNI
jgi:hypothetical protein